MAYPISDVTRRVVYTGSAGVGPYSFTFEVLANTDIQVYKNTTLLTLTTNYTVTINSNGTGSVTLVSAATGTDTITIVGDRAIQRATDFVTGGDLFANTLNDEFDSLVIFAQQVDEKADRGLKAPVTDPTDVNMVLPDKASRSGYVLSFNTTTGNPEVTTTVGAISSAATNATNAAASASAASTSASNASSSASAASSSASSASSSATAAAASAAAGMYSAVQDKSAAYTVVTGDAGDLIRVTTTAGAVTITLPLISGQVDGFKIAVVKWSSDANAVTVARSGSDTINGATSYSIATQYNSATFVADYETNQWFAASSGLGTSNVAVDVFSGNNSTVAFTLSGDPGSKNNTLVEVSGVYQQKSTYTVSGTTLTFSTAPPTGTSNIEVVWTAPLAIGTPSDGTVTTAKLASTTGSGAVVLGTSPTITTPTISSLSSASATALTLQSAGTTAVTIDTSQNVGIGTTSPAGRLHVSSTSDVEVRSATTGANYATFRLKNSSQDYSMQIRTDQSNAWTLRDETAGVNRMTCITSGQVGINVVAASGNTFRVVNIGSDNAVQFGNVSNGVYLANGGTSFSAYSDIRLKNIIGKYETPLADIEKLDAIKFTWKNDTENKPQVGVSAQSVETVIPEAIDRGTNFNVEGDTTEYLSVRYTELIPLMIASIQELKAINDTQAETINALTARVTALEGN